MTGAESVEFRELVETARQYCGLIDRIAAGTDWLAPVFQILPRLHARVVSLRDSGGVGFPPDSSDLDARFDLFSRLRMQLGEQDMYWLEFDNPDDAAEHLSGSLADDLTDIYFELKRGLQLLDTAGPEVVAHLWERGFEQHWGQHLVDAERHLYSLRTHSYLH